MAIHMLLSQTRNTRHCHASLGIDWSVDWGFGVGFGIWGGGVRIGIVVGVVIGVSHCVVPISRRLELASPWGLIWLA